MGTAQARHKLLRLFPRRGGQNHDELVATDPPKQIGSPEYGVP